jgi:ribonucleotide reductase beta subunit family protein with ferritin-like domain
MLMKELHVPGTDSTPEAHFKPNGYLRIKGRAFRILKEQVAKELNEWLKLYNQDPSEETKVTLAFEYMNTLTSSIFTSILLNIAPARKLAIYWYYESDDEVMLERGKFISNSLNFPFNFIETDNIRRV